MDDEESVSLNAEDDARESGSSSGDSRTEGTFQKPRQVAGSELTKGVIRLKLSVLFVLISSAIGVSVFTYIYLTQIELKSYQAQFEDDASKVMEAIGGNIDKTLSALDSIAVTLVSHAQATNQTWPFVTLPNFAVRMAKVLPQSQAVILNVIPVVTPEQRDQWEKYSVENDGWVNDNMAVQKEWGKFYGPIVFDGEPNTVMRGDFGIIERNASRFHLPTWQNFPVLANVSASVDFSCIDARLQHTTHSPASLFVSSFVTGRLRIRTITTGCQYLLPIRIPFAWATKQVRRLTVDRDR
jgi:hypothetical protein